MPTKFNYPDVIQATFQAIKNQGGSASVSQIRNHVVEILNCYDYEDNLLNNGRNELDLKLSYSRTLLKYNGVITNPSKGIWIILGDYQNKDSIDAEKIFDSHKEMGDRTKNKYKKGMVSTQKDIESERNEKEAQKENESEIDEVFESNEDEIAELDIIDSLLEKIKSISPRAFENLSIRVLNTIGLELEPTQYVRDDGIDGTGVFSLNKVIKFNVKIQCKRYTDAKVDAPTVSQFRGHMSTGVDRGIFITTSSFTEPAKREAINPSYPNRIDLIDGQEFAKMLFEEKIGYIKIEETKYFPDSKTKTTYKIDEDYFNDLEKAK